MENKGFVNGGLQESITEGGIKLKIKMMSSRGRSDDVEIVSLKETMTVPGCSSRAGDNDDVVGDALPERECKVCSKCFSSGRALAGHMRVHGGGASTSPPQKPVGEAQIPQNNLKNNSHGVGEERPAAVKTKIPSATPAPIAVCVLCTKEFPSMKSLFGHMRCHPDRDWRGIQPPENFLSSSSSTVSNWEPKPESQISTWPVTTRRCKKRTLADSQLGTAEGNAFRDSDDPILDAAYDLLMLRNANAPLATMDSSLGNGSKQGGEKKKKKKKKKKLGALMGRLEKFRCDSCHKAFPSHQALGGHKTSHRKDHLVTNSMEEELEEEEEEEEGDTPPTKKAEPRAHECKICHKRFPSGQALGGHKRCHWNEERAAMKMEADESSPRPNTITKEEKTTPEVATTTAAASVTLSMLDFDLNEVAPVDDLDLHALYTMVEMVPGAAKLMGAENAALVTNPSTA